MASNSDFGQCKEENKRQSFFKVLQRADLSSENMRALPHDFVRSFSDNDLSGKMKIKAKWGSSWEIEVAKNPRFYFLEKSGWEKFVRDNGLGQNEFVTFTHKRKMSFTLNIFKQDGKEILQAPQSMAFLASSSRVKTEQREESINNDVREEEVLVSSEMSKHGPTRAESNGGRSYKRKKLFDDSGKKKAKESHNSKKIKISFSVGRNNTSSSSSTSSELIIEITRSYLSHLAIKRAFARVHMPERSTMFKIHHQGMKKSWNVVYLSKKTNPELGTERNPCFSAGWSRLAKEYPITVGDICKFTFIKPDEMLLVVSKL